MTDCPRASASFAATIRATKSAAPPGGTVTTSWIGRVGYPGSARAGFPQTKATTKSTRPRKTHIYGLLPSALDRPAKSKASSAMPIKLTENFRAVFYAPFYATQALGFYAREGVEVELLPSPAPAVAQKDLLDGTIDLSWGGPMRVMKARDKDSHSPLVCFCEVVARDPFF